MDESRLVLSGLEFKELYLDFLDECREDVKDRGFECTIPLSSDASFEDDIRRLLDNREGRGLPEGWVPASVYWLLDGSGSRLLGAVAVRHRLAGYLYFRGGHISYYVRPSERRKGYAASMLSLALDKCREMGLDRVMITCAKDNAASAKTILKNGGLLHSEDMENGEIFQRYWIDL